jgi:hypothetical protein
MKLSEKRYSVWNNGKEEAWDYMIMVSDFMRNGKFQWFELVTLKREDGKMER